MIRVSKQRRYCEILIEWIEDRKIHTDPYGNTHKIQTEANLENKGEGCYDRK